MNDGLLVLSLSTGRFTLWLGTGCYAASLGLWWTEDARPYLASGNYWGRVHYFDYAATQETQSGAISSGTVGAGSTSTTLRPSTGTVLDAATDWRQLGEFLTKLHSTNGFESRMVIDSDGTDFEVNPGWTNTPVTGESWWIGAYYVAFESGDLTWTDLGQTHLLERFQLHFEDEMASANAMDVAFDSTDVAETGTGMTFANATVPTDDTHPWIDPNTDAGYTQRARVTSLVNGARWVLRAVTLQRARTPHPHGG